MLDETRIRLDAINFVRALRERWVTVPAAELRRFRIHLKGQSGIFKPAGLTLPLSLTTTIDSRHAQDTIEGSRVLYDYASQPHQNEALKSCAEAQLPLIYFLQARRRPVIEYVIFAPVYVVGWSDRSRCFAVDLSEQKPGQAVTPAPAGHQLSLEVMPTPGSRDEIRELTRTYAVSSVQRRLYKVRFRNAVLDAYGGVCAVCGLRVRALLDVVFINSGGEPGPEIDVREGMALCAIHQRAFHAGILSFDADFVIRIDLADRVATGPGEESMLLAFHGKRLFLPGEERFQPRHAFGG